MRPTLDHGRIFALTAVVILLVCVCAPFVQFRVLASASCLDGWNYRGQSTVCAFLMDECAIYIDPALVERNLSDVGSTFDVRVSVQNIVDLFGFDFNVTWNNALITLVAAEYSSELDNVWGSGKWTTIKNDTAPESYKLVATSTLSGFSGTQPLAKLTFRVEYSTISVETLILFDVHKLSDSNWTPIQHVANDGTYRIHVPNFTLAVSTVGQGSVSLNSSGPYDYGDVVELTAVPATGWSFQGWSGDLLGSVNPAVLVVTGNMSVLANFTQNVYTLTVDVVGGGVVNLNNTGPYHYGDRVEFTAVPDVDWSFDHWSGGLSGSANPAALTITGNVAVTGYFSFTGIRVYIDPYLTVRRTADIGVTFDVNVMIQNMKDLWGFDFNLTWDSSLLTLVDVDFNTPLDRVWGAGKWTPVKSESGSGYYKLVAVSISSSFNGTGATSLAALTFRVEDPQTNFVKETAIHFRTHEFSNSTWTPIAHRVEDGLYRFIGIPPGTHDIAVAGVTCLKTIVGQGYTTNVTVTIWNQGDYAETFNVSLYGNLLEIATVRGVILGSGMSKVIMFTWNTLGFSKGDYVVRASATPVSGETDTTNNIYTHGIILITIPGDVTGDVWVDMLDISILIENFMVGPPNCYPNCDINSDSRIDMADISIAVGNFMVNP